MYKLGDLYTILLSLYKEVFKDSALYLRDYQKCPRCEFGEIFAFCEIHFHPHACVIFLIYLVFEEIKFCAGAAFMGQVIGDDQMIHFKVRD